MWELGWEWETRGMVGEVFLVWDTIGGGRPFLVCEDMHGEGPSLYVKT